MQESLEQTELGYCSLVSLNAEEDLFATASQVQVFLLLEYNGAYGYKAFEQSNIPENIKEHINQVLSEIPLSKILLLHSRSGLLERGISLFVIKASEQQPALYRFLLQNYNELLDLDIPAILSGSEEYQEYRRTEPLVTVCTNGRRDFCCAKFGVPTYNEMLNLAEDTVWQSSHVGGHRFAPNVFAFPHGILHGRLQPEDAAGFLEHVRKGELDLDHYRGRSTYSKPGQAAEYFLRKQTGRLDMEAFHLLESEKLPEKNWLFTFGDGNKHYRLAIRREDTGREVWSGCSDQKTTQVVQYHLEGYTEE